MKFLGILLSLFAMVGCVSVEDNARIAPPTEAPPPTANETPQPKALATDDLKVIDLPMPHQHAVELQFKNSVNVIRRSEAGIEKFEELVVPPGKVSLSDTQVLEGKTYAYVLGAYVDGDFKAQKKLEALIPKDLVIEKDFQNTSAATLDWTEFKRIYFQPSVQVFTYGADLKINADLVVFNETTIASFPGHAKAAPGQVARNGGSIEIEAKLVSGFVRFQLNGEHGFDGTPGISYDTPAHQGRISRSLLRNVDDGNTMACDYIAPPFQPTKGEDGTIAGGNGGAAGNGGNSGSLQLSFIDEDHFRYSLASQPGQPGVPGALGRGQKGGDSGYWQKLVPSDCEPATQSPLGKGNDAPDGKVGASGVAGKLLSNCVFRIGQTPVCQQN